MSTQNKNRRAHPTSPASPTSPTTLPELHVTFGEFGFPLFSDTERGSAIDISRALAVASRGCLRALVVATKGDSSLGSDEVRTALTGIEALLELSAAFQVQASHVDAAP